MADLLLACRRGGAGGSDELPAPPITAESLRRAARLLGQPGIDPHPALVADGDGVVAAIVNPQPGGGELRAPSVEDQDRSGGGAYIGVLYGEQGAWWRVGSAAPEGTYGLVRWDGRSVELVADVCATRTLWYASTGDHFLVSTSQRAIVALLGSYEHEPQAVSWMLSSGTLGPEVSWDARLRRLPPNARVTLDRTGWTTTERLDTVAYPSSAGDRESRLARLRAALLATCAAFRPDLDRWPLALSGGVDSRVLLAAFAAAGRLPRCITWTTRASLRDPLSDVSIARAVARRFKAEHEVILIDAVPGGVAEGVDMFVKADEGRNDDIVAYMDGMRMWRDLFDAGVQGIVRGDECSGVTWRPPAHAMTRLVVVGPTVDDHPADHAIRDLGLAPQSVPVRLLPRPDEDRVYYRQRMIEQGYIAGAASGLNGVKARYVEIANPHLSRRVIAAVHALPPELLRGKTALGAIARAATPFIMTARSGSTPSRTQAVASDEFIAILVRELTDPAIERVLPGDGARRVLAALITIDPAAPSLSTRAKRMVRQAAAALPTDLWQRIKPPQKAVHLPASRLALRVLLASRTVRRLEEDARVLRD